MPAERQVTKSTVGFVAKAQPLRTLDDEFAEIADVVPGFGGLYFDEDGEIVVVLQRPELLAEKRDELTAALSEAQSKRRAIFPHHVLSFAGASAVPGKFSFRELFDVYNGVLADALPRISGLATTDIDEVRNRIAIGVTSESDVGKARGLLTELGVPAAMISVDVTMRPTLNYDLSDHLRPVPGAAKVFFADSESGCLEILHAWL